MTVKVLILGLPGAGKTTLADALFKQMPFSLRLNADKLRQLHGDWDFSYAGRLRQATRMRNYADISEDPVVIADFVCPLPEMRTIFNADLTVWVDTIRRGRYENTNKLFVPPSNADVQVLSHDTQHWVSLITQRVHELLAYRSDVRKIAVNPPIVVDVWPVKPDEVWVEVPAV